MATLYIVYKVRGLDKNRFQSPSYPLYVNTGGIMKLAPKTLFKRDYCVEMSTTIQLVVNSVCFPKIFYLMWIIITF